MKVAFIKEYPFGMFRRVIDNLCYKFMDNGYALLPRNIMFEVTHRCNLRCKMCGYYGEAGVAPNCRDEMSIVEIEKILDNICDFSPFVTITGGEPFIRKDMIDILELFNERNLKFGILTNGTLVNHDIARKLADLNPAFINISMDGPKEIHEIIRGHNTFDKTIGCIRSLKDNGYQNITINCVISKMNFEHMHKMVGVANDLDVKLQYQHLQFTDKKRDDMHKKMIKKYFNFDHEDRTSGICTKLFDFDINKLIEQIRNIKIADDRIKFMPDLTLDDVGKYYLDLDNYIHSEYCMYPWREARINPYGEMVYCIMEPTAGNLLDLPFGDIWNNKDMRHFRKVLRDEKLFPNCARCCKI